MSFDLDSAGTFFDQLGGAFAKAYTAVNAPAPVQFQRTSGIPQGAAVQTGGNSNLTQLAILLVVGLGIGLLIRQFTRREA